MPNVLNSGLKIFDIIEALWQNPTSREDLSKILLEKNISINKETISKYLRTLRGLGFEIISDKKREYTILKTPFKFELDDSKEGFYVFKNVFSEVFENNKKLKNYLEYKLDNLFDINQFEKPPKNPDITISKDTLSNLLKLKSVIENQEKIKFSYKKEEIKALPMQIRYSKNGFFLNAYIESEQKVKIFKIEKIKNIKIYKTSINDFEPMCKTTFVLKGELIKNYILREHEIAHYSKDSVAITNFCEEKEELFNRLMKYGAYCEIVSPESDRQKFKQTLISTIKHYKSM